MIASHYAEPVPRVVRRAATLREAPAVEADAIEELAAGTAFDLLDDSVGWAWGYAGDEGIVGYVQSSALG